MEKSYRFNFLQIKDWRIFNVCCTICVQWNVWKALSLSLCASNFMRRTYFGTFSGQRYNGYLIYHYKVDYNGYPSSLSNFITENSLASSHLSDRLNYPMWPQSLYSPDGGPPSPTVSSHSVQSPQPTPAPRWPLKPGVLVHINRTHSLRSGLSVRANEANLHNELVGKHNDEPLRQRFLDETSLSSIGRNPARAVFRRGRKDQIAQRTTSMTSLNEDGMLARANKIKAMFGVQLKEQATLPGISREKTGKSSGRSAVLFTRDFARCHPMLTRMYLQLPRSNELRARISSLTP